MVADTIDYYILNLWNINILIKRFRIGSINLYIILMNREKALETIVILALVSLIIFLRWNIDWLIYLSIGLLILSLISKKLTALIGKSWLVFSRYLGMTMNYIILFLIFHLILIPLSLLQRLIGKNQILNKKNSNSYFHQRKHLFTKKDIEHPW
jgi:hypothetical protein